MTAGQMAMLTSLRRARERREAQALAAAHAARQQAFHARDQADRAFRSFSVLRRVQEAVILRGLNQGPMTPARVIGAAADMAQLAEREAHLRRRAVDALAAQRDRERGIATALRDWSHAHRRTEVCDLLLQTLCNQDIAAQENRAEQDLDAAAALRRGGMSWMA